MHARTHAYMHTRTQTCAHAHAYTHTQLVLVQYWQLCDGAVVSVFRYASAFAFKIESVTTL